MHTGRQSSHWYASVIGSAPLHVPGVDFSVAPTTVRPEMTGRVTDAGGGGSGGGGGGLTCVVPLTLGAGRLAPSALLAISCARITAPTSDSWIV